MTLRALGALLSTQLRAMSSFSRRSYLFSVLVRAETRVEDSGARVPGAALRLEEALGLGEYHDTVPAQVGLQPRGAGDRAYLKERRWP